jgi:hypothetical protein
MQALAVEKLPEGDWLYEVKLDGYRAMALICGLVYPKKVASGILLPQKKGRETFLFLACIPKVSPGSQNKFEPPTNRVVSPSSRRRAEPDLTDL